MEKKNSYKIKLALAIAVPLMVMIITITMVGASFAWFSQNANTEVSTISLSTKEAFTLVFTAAENTESMYEGQMAFKNAKMAGDTDPHMYMINDYRAKDASQLGFSASTAQYEYYMDDIAYEFSTTVGFDTNGKEVDVNLTFDTCDIYNASKHTHIDIYGLNYPGTAYAPHAAADLPYLFTWYIRKLDAVGDFADNIFYTPYGTMQMGEDGGYPVCTKLNGTTVTNSTSLASATASGFTFEANSAQVYKIFVVFAPQKAYWMQFFKADRNKSLETIYSGVSGLFAPAAPAVGIITRSLAPTQLFYSTKEYAGNSFTLTAALQVVGGLD